MNEPNTVMHHQPNESKIDLKGLNKDELVAVFASMGEPSYRAVQVMTWLYLKRATSFEEMTNLSKTLRQKLNEQAQISNLLPAKIQQSVDGTRKYLFQLADGQRVESVFIPEENRNTLCISSQVGCAIGCTFCATGKMGLIRNMTAGEIVDQIITVSRDVGIDQRISNVVMMGMGEPFHNYTNVVKAVRLMIDETGLQIGGRKITVSTSGLIPRIYDFANENLNVRLAISLNASHNGLRDQIMPINKKYKIEELIEAARHFHRETNNRVTFEYVLLKDTTDSLEDARRLVKLTSVFPCKVNLIPYNADSNAEYQPPDPEKVERFYEYMTTHHPFAITLRKNRGRDILAACGQLRLRTENP